MFGCVWAFLKSQDYLPKLQSEHWLAPSCPVRGPPSPWLCPSCYADFATVRGPTNCLFWTWLGLSNMMIFIYNLYIYIYMLPPPRTYVSEAATLLEGILPCCNDLSKEDGRCCWFINNFRFINSQDEIRDVALNYLIRLSLVRSFVIKNPYILDSIDITPNQNFVEYCKFNKIDHKKSYGKS